MSSTNWQNLPSTSTPLNATNLNKIEKKIKTYYIPTNIGDVAGWYLVASGEIGTYSSHAFVLSIQQILDVGAGSGLLYVNIRRNDSNSILSSFKWLSNTGLSSSDFKIKLDGNNYYLYMKIPSVYGQYQIKVIEESDLNNQNENILTFYTPTASDTVAEPTGTNPNAYESINVTSYVENGQVTAFKNGNIVIARIHGSMANSMPNTWTDYAVAKLNGIVSAEDMASTVVDQSNGLSADIFIGANSDTIYINKRSCSAFTGDWIRGELVFISK